MASVGKPRYTKDGQPVWDVLFRDNGKQRGKSFRDERAAIAFAAEITATADRPGGRTNPTKVLQRHGIQAPPVGGLTVTEAVELCIAECWANDTNRTKYRQILNNDIAPAFGDLRISKLTFDEIYEWIEFMGEYGMKLNPKDKGNRPKTIRNKYFVLSAALNAAVARGDILAHPCTGKRDFLPNVKRAQKRVLSIEEFNQLLGGFLNDEIRLFVQFLCASGCRFNEATALQPEDIDIAKGTVYIQQAWSWIPPGARTKTNPQHYRLKDPKTETSIREIDIAHEMLEKVKDAGMLDPAREFVFLNADGGPIRRTTFKNVWDAAVIRSGLPGRKPKVKDLRTTYATDAINSGIERKVVRNQLGHSDESTTEKWYVEFDRRESRAAANAHGKRWFG